MTSDLETGWLIGRPADDVNPPIWVGVVGGPVKNFAWVYDASVALRFARREDAQTCIDNVPWFRRQDDYKAIRAEEHQWG